MEQFRVALATAGEGDGQMVAVVGDPGVGKSRLFYEFTRSHRMTESGPIVSQRSHAVARLTADADSRR